MSCSHAAPPTLSVWPPTSSTVSGGVTRLIYSAPFCRAARRFAGTSNLSAFKIDHQNAQCLNKLLWRERVWQCRQRRVVASLGLVLFAREDVGAIVRSLFRNRLAASDRVRLFGRYLARLALKIRMGDLDRASAGLKFGSKIVPSGCVRPDCLSSTHTSLPGGALLTVALNCPTTPKKEKCRTTPSTIKKKTENQEPRSGDPDPSRNAALCLFFLCFLRGLFGRASAEEPDTLPARPPATENTALSFRRPPNRQERRTKIRVRHVLIFAARCRPIRRPAALPLLERSSFRSPHGWYRSA